ncbi:MAG: hypothetical protein LJE69_16640 [Thiohalocapsa sp.]|uniref:hypothetical protein n=1 Tax=Thiohalocapsa sp. TaxID=2497641 RepID=UPI0025D786EA|nr:hypothetical protein [Thiohalocapsa sp.]MCG6942865.1 hypothetical protein [Thiohalocapsa sp.]
MPILIDELELDIEPGGEPAPATDPLASVTPVTPAEQEVLTLLALADERRARLLVD